MIQGRGASGQSLDQQRDGSLFLWTELFGLLRIPANSAMCADPR
jgi:hypothetical protein